MLSLVTLGLARADVAIVSQPANATNIVSQVFPDDTLFSTFAFDDFSTATAYDLTTLTVLGTEIGNPGANVAVIAEIWDGLPGSGSKLVSFSGSENSSTGTLSFALGGFPLDPGSYWMTAYVTRPVTGGQWFADTSTPVHGSQAEIWNLGNGFGHGTTPVGISAYGGTPQDLAFTLSGNPAVPEPTSVILLGSVLCLLARRQYRGRSAKTTKS